MKPLMNHFFAPLLVSALMLTGCGGSDTHDEHAGHTEDDGHDHASHGADEHAAEQGLGEIEIAGSQFGVSVGGEPGPNITLHLHLELKSGPTPSAIRVWVGGASATGSVKGKASGTNGRYHVDATCPAELADDAALWIEVESADGTKTSGSLPLGHDDA